MNIQQFLIIGGTVFMSFLFSSCCTSKNIGYEVRTLDRQWPQGLEQTEENYEKISKNGNALYVVFIDIVNNKYTNVTIHYFSTQKFEEVKINSFLFQFGDEEKEIRINKKYKLSSELSQFAVDGVEPITGYSTLIYYVDSSIKLYLQDVFKKSSDSIGEAFNVKLVVDFSIDGSEPVSDTLYYRVHVYKKTKTTPDWMYLLFPGM